MDLIPVNHALTGGGGGGGGEGGGVGSSYCLSTGTEMSVIKSLSANHLSTSGNVIQSISHRLAAARTVE